MSRIKIKLAEKIESWQNGKAQYITFVLTEDCQLQCKYCYICKKNSFEKMEFDTAKETVDFILQNRQIYSAPFVVWAFIGGEPLLEIDLMSKICDYITFRMNELDHPWHDKYRFHLSSNGLLYKDDRVQRFIEKNISRLSIGISIDGNKQKHDTQRVFPNGIGSYDAVASVIPLWQEQFPGAPTKATISHEDLPFVKESVLDLWRMGIKEVAMNCVFENVWQDGDDDIFEDQLIQLADTIINLQLYDKHKVTLFARNIGFALDLQHDNRNFCGAGRMLAIDTRGNFYPCLRFINYSLENKEGLKIGNRFEGIDANKLRPFLSLNRTTQSEIGCITCDIASGCAWCSGYNYDVADTNTIFQRSISLCKMHKARVRANNYLWNKLDKIIVPPEDDIRTQRLKQRKGLQSLIVIADSSAKSFCYYEHTERKTETMSINTLNKIVYYALTNNLTLTILSQNELNDEFKYAIKDVDHIMLSNSRLHEKTICVFDFESDTWNSSDDFCQTLIVRMETKNLQKLPEWLIEHSLSFSRISLIIKDQIRAIEKDFINYQNVLARITAWLPEREEEKSLELAFLTDRLILTDRNHCDAGIKHITVAPDGGLYLCPGFYYDGDPPFSDIVEVLKTHNVPMKNQQLLNISHAPICEACDAFHCKRCVYLNKKSTLEVNTPSHQQCVFSHLERNASQTLIAPLFLQDDVSIPEIDYLDPYKNIASSGGRQK